MNARTLELEEAQKLALESIKPLEGCKVALLDSIGRVFHEDIYASINVPSFKRSPLDGFTLMASNTKGASIDCPVSIKVVGEIQAGDTRQELVVRIGEGYRIMTGGAIPKGADVVVRQEDVKYQNGVMYLNEELIRNKNIGDIGSDMKIGDLIAKKGDIVTPYHVGALSALGIMEIEVYKTPVIAVIGTGEELVPPGEKLQFGKIYNSNTYAIMALLAVLGANGENVGCVSDNVEKIASALEEALTTSDLVITTGGVSVGDFDLVRKALDKIDAYVLFTRINIKPGTPTMAAVKGGKLILALSGNPAASIIGFELLARPAIKKMRGLKDITFNYIKATLVDGFNKRSPQRRFLRVRVVYDENFGWIASQTGSQQSSVLKSMIGCNALVDIPAGSKLIEPGNKVNLLMLEN